MNRIEELEAEVARLKSATEWQKAALAQRDERIAELEEALKAVLDGNDLAAERGHSIESWPGSAIRRETIAVLYPKGDAPKEGAG